MQTLEDEVIVVTGASRGLGESMALRFAAEGARVVLTARSRNDLDDVAAAASGETLVAPGDVTEPDDVDAVIEATVDAYGGIDTLVNNAAIGLLSLGVEPKRVAEVTPSEWDQVMATNVNGVFYFTRAALPAMLDDGGGNVINITSGLGRRVRLLHGTTLAPYTVSKWGLEALTRAVHEEYHDEGVNANALGPGGRVLTAFWDHLPEDEHDELLQPDVMDDAAVALAAQGPGGFSGESLDADEWEDRFGVA